MIKSIYFLINIKSNINIYKFNEALILILLLVIYWCNLKAVLSRALICIAFYLAVYVNIQSSEHTRIFTKFHNYYYNITVGEVVTRLDFYGRRVGDWRTV